VHKFLGYYNIILSHGTSSSVWYLCRNYIVTEAWAFAQIIFIFIPLHGLNLPNKLYK
jgi:hypothetical protein